MTRLPQPGKDIGTWGGILNDFLTTAHNPDGSLKSSALRILDSSITTPQLADNAVTDSKLDVATQTTLATVASKYTKPAGGVPLADLSSSLRANSTKAGTSVQQVNNKTPDGAGALTLTAADVGAATSLGGLSDVNATGATNSQVLSYNTGSSKWTAATVTSTTVSDASNTGKGILQLAGDLGGSNDPTNPTISTGAVTDAKVATGAAIQQSKIQNLTTALNAKAPTASPTFSGTVTVPTPANPTDATTKGYVDSQVTTGSTPDASPTIKGKIQLAGDLAGTAASPTVAKLSGVSLAGLATGLLKNTTGTGVPSIATASDIPDLSATYAPIWRPLTAYAAGAAVVNPSGDLVTATTAFTSGTTYSAINWALSPSYMPASGIAVNLLNASQSDFESGTPSPAFTYYQASGAITLGGTSGTHQLTLTSTGTNDSLYPPTFNASAGQTFTARVNMNTTNTSILHGHISIQFNNGSTVLQTVISNYHSGSGLYETLSVTAPAPANTTMFYVFIYGGMASGGTSSIDQFMVGQPSTGTASIAISSRVILPTDISAVVGDTLQVFVRGVIEAQAPYGAPYKMVCSKGSAYPRFFEWTPLSGDSGTTVPLVVTTQAPDQTTLATATTNIVVKTAANPASMKRIMCVGDSLTSGMLWPQEAYRRLTQSGGTPAGNALSNFSFIGSDAFPSFPSQGSIGRGGWSWGTYTNSTPVNAYAIVATAHGKDTTDQVSNWTDANGHLWYIQAIIDANNLLMIANAHAFAMPASGTLTWAYGGTHTSAIVFTSTAVAVGTPFWSGSAFSIASWVNANGGIGPDLLIALLGWNSITTSAVASGYVAALVQARVFMDKLHSEYPSAKAVVLGLQAPSPSGGLGTNYGATGTYSQYYDLLRYANGYNLALQSWAAEAGYSSWLRYAAMGTQYDAENNGLTAAAPVNSRSATTEVRGTNGVHPATNGYYQIADVAYREIIRALSP